MRMCVATNCAVVFLNSTIHFAVSSFVVAETSESGNTRLAEEDESVEDKSVYLGTTVTFEATTALWHRRSGGGEVAGGCGGRGATSARPPFKLFDRSRNAERLSGCCFFCPNSALQLGENDVGLAGADDAAPTAPIRRPLAPAEVAVGSYI